MGRVVVEAMLESLEDLWAARNGALPADRVRRVVVADSLIDTGATLLSLPTHVIRELGVRPVATKRLTTTGGPREAVLYDTVRLTIQGRSCNVGVLELPAGVPTLIGQIPLGHLDFVVDPRNQQLVGNPAHGGEHPFELY